MYDSWLPTNLKQQTWDTFAMKLHFFSWPSCGSASLPCKLHQPPLCSRNMHIWQMQPCQPTCFSCINEIVLHNKINQFIHPTMYDPRPVFHMSTTFSFLYSNDLRVHKLPSGIFCHPNWWALDILIAYCTFYHPNWWALDIPIAYCTFVPISSSRLIQVLYRKI